MPKITIQLAIPPGTDVEGFVSAYGSLLRAHRVKCDIPSQDVQLNHPLEEAREQILGDFQRTNSQLQSISAKYADVSVSNVLSDGRKMTIILACDKPNSEFINADFSHQSQ